MGVEQRISRGTIVLALLLAATPYRAPAQSSGADSALHVLTLPIGPLLHCTARDSAAVTMVKLRLGEGSMSASREIDVSYDSLGRSHALLDFGSSGALDAPRLDAVVARFDASGAAVFGFHRVDTVGSRGHEPALVDSSHLNPKVFPPLTAEDLARAHALTAWVWKHHCHIAKA